MAIRAYTLSRNSFCQVGTIDCNTRQGEWKLFLTMTPTECNRAQVYYYAGNLLSGTVRMQRKNRRQ